ncbi:uncharacterized protein LOC141671409 [Apium graveolens]|uniref:uncharacterized protein LOC141671409 n=1 Tax=Apium graveolens TaxID=4045 RepID=UPI003D7ABEB2
MHLGRCKTDDENQKIEEFSKWVLDVGDSKVDNIHPGDIFSDLEIVIPKRFLLEKFTNSVKYIVDNTYPDFVKNMKSHTYSKERAILSPANAIVDYVNTHVLCLIPEA